MKWLTLLVVLFMSCTNHETTTVSKKDKVRTEEMSSNKLQASNAQMELQAISYDNVFLEVPAAQKVAYLTFDDGPSKYTEELLDTLAELGVKATFFVLGSSVEKNPKITARLLKERHTIGNHTYDHKHFKDLSNPQVLTEFALTRQALAQCNVITDLVRIPWGNISDAQLKLIPDLRVIHWSINTDDWYFNKKENGADSIANRIINYCYPGAIILAHDGGGNRSKTIIGVAKAVRQLQAEGWTFSKIPLTLK